MSTASNVHKSWKEIIITPSVGAAIALSEVTSGTLIDEDTLIPWRADGNPYVKIAAISESNRGFSVAGGNIGQLASVPKGTPCTITAKLYDAINGAGTGCLLLTLFNAVAASASATGETNQYASGGITFMAFSPDGVTDPLAIARQA